jgi:hypothetical protein
MNRLALDISAVLVLGAIGVLPQVLCTFGTVMVAAGVMYELFNGQRRLREFQRSRVARAAQLQTLVDTRISCNTIPGITVNRHSAIQWTRADCAG